MDCDNNADRQHIRVLPDTCVELFINYTSTPIAIISNKTYRHSIITYRTSRPIDVQMRKGSGCLAICFYPGMAYRFFHLPMHELTDTTALLADVWKGIATQIEDELANAPTNNERAAIAQQYLLQQLARSKADKQVGYCLRQANHAVDALSVQQLANDTGISQRHLSRRFQQYIGLSPKEFLRVSRFVRSLQHLKKFPALSLTDIAYESGYYDQAHFIRDYKIYAGYTPREVATSQHIMY